MNKEKKVKKAKKQEVKQTTGEIPTFKSPQKTLGGKIIIGIIVAAMVLIPVIAIIFAIIGKMG